MSFDKSLEKKLFYLLDDLEFYVTSTETPPHKRPRVLKLAFLSIYSLLKSTPIVGSPLIDWFVTNKPSLLSSSFVFSGNQNSKDDFLLLLIDGIRQSISLLCFYKTLCDADLRNQDDLVKKLHQMIVSLKKDKPQRKEFFTFTSSVNGVHSDFLSSISTMLLNDDITEFRITGFKSNTVSLDQCVELQIEVDTSCSLEWIQQNYPLLDWGRLLDGNSAETFFYHDVIESIVLYEDSGAFVSPLNDVFFRYVSQKIQAYRLRYAFQIDDLVESCPNIEFKQKLANIFFPKIIKKELQFFLEEKIDYTNDYKLISYFRFNGESYLSVLSSQFEGVSEENALSSESSEDKMMTGSYSMFARLDLEDSFLLEYDSLYLDVLIITLSESKYLVPKYQIQGVVPCQNSMLTEQDSFYYDLNGLNVLVFQHIDWSFYPKKPVHKSEGFSDKKIVFIEQAGVIFGLVCEYVSEATSARKLNSKNTTSSLAAFWSTREGDILGEFTPIRTVDGDSLEPIKDVKCSEGGSCDIAFLGRDGDTLIAVENGVDCSVENIALDRVFELNNRNNSDSQISYFTLFGGWVYPIKNFKSDLEAKHLQRGNLVFFHDKDKRFAVYFSSITFDVESVIIDGSKVLLWDSLVAMKSVQCDDQGINVIVKSR